MIVELFAKFIKDKRTAMGMTQAQFAELLIGDPKQHHKIGNIENGKNRVRIDTMSKYLEILNCSIEIIEN